MTAQPVSTISAELAKATAAIATTLTVLLDAGQVTELRALAVSTPSYRRPHIVSGYFDDFAKLSIEAAKLSPVAQGVYIIPNPVNPTLLARSVNRVRNIDDRESTTSDNDVTARHWLLIDADPVRPTGISSSNPEHEAALAKANEIRDTLRAEGWPEPILADSGNGAHLMYRIDLPVQDGELVKRALSALAFRFDDVTVTIDQKVFNPARIWKLYGTLARKGDNTPERPHRPSRLLETPALTVVPHELLEMLVASAPSPESARRRAVGSESFDLNGWIVKHALDVAGPFSWQSGSRWIFRQCPWNADHHNRSAWLVQFATGAVAAGCQHNSCAGNDWHALRDLMEPGWQAGTQLSRLNGTDQLEAAHECLLGLQQQGKDKPSDAVKDALRDVETLGALALVAERDRGSYEVTLMELREAGVPSRDIRALEKAITARRRSQPHKLRVLQSGEECALTPVKTVLINAPLSEAIVVPAGWRLDENGLAKETTSIDESGAERISLTPVAPTPVLIVGRLKDVSDNSESTRLAWLRDGRWTQHPAPRALVANTRTIVELAGMGLPVTSLTASALVAYLASFEATNIQQLPRAHVSKQMGWLGDNGKLGFLWGRALIRPDGVQAATDIDTLTPDQWHEGLVSFRGEDTGDEQIADGYYAAGTMEGWRAVVKPVGQYPRVAIMLYGALATPLLSVLEVPNFTIDLAYLTSTGKTTALRVAGSCWGNPDERALSSTVGTWDATRVWIERASTVLNGLPLILDDTKRAKNPKQVAQVIYDVSSGKGRGRGSPKGMRRAGAWCTILLSTGEAPVTSFTEDGGTRGRVLSLWGKAFERTNKATAQIVHGIDSGVRHHFGYAGPKLVEFIQQHRADWDDWRAEFRAVQTQYLEKAEGDPVASRYAAYLAVLDVTAALAHAALELPWDYRDPIATLWEGLLAGARDADRSSVALEYVQSWAQGHQAEFWGHHETDQFGHPRIPAGGWAGRWDEKEGWEYIGFLPDRLRAVLVAGDYEPEPVLRIWKERGWELPDSDGKRLYQAKVGHVNARLIAIRRTAFDAVDTIPNGAEENADDTPPLCGSPPVPRFRKKHRLACGTLCVCAAVCLLHTHTAFFSWKPIFSGDWGTGLFRA